MTAPALDRAPRHPAARWAPALVVLAIGLAVLVPSLLGRRGGDALPPLRLPPTAAPAKSFPVSATLPKEWSPRRKTLVLYDRGGPWGWIGELNAIMAANLVSHFGRWSAKPVQEYRAGDLVRSTAVVYLGSTYDERLPAGFLRDVLAGRRPVLWAGANIWQLQRQAHDFGGRYGWIPDRLDRSPVEEVSYKGRVLTRSAANEGGIMKPAFVLRSRATVLARAVRRDGSSFPWAIRSRNLTYVGELPFPYASETDRVLAFADLLFDALAPRTSERHRALVRLEDIDPLSDPQDLRDAAAYLHAERIPFGFGVVPRYRDPTGGENGGEPQDVRLRDAPEVVAAIKYLQRMGGVLVDHGYTHQWDGGHNPYNGATGDDFEFFRVVETKAGGLRYEGALPDDTSSWPDRRLASAIGEFEAAGLRAPLIVEFPHYAASAAAYKAAARRFPVRWERSFYFSGLLSGKDVQERHLTPQFFPFVVRDVYGNKVLPENLGAVTPQRWRGNPSRDPSDVIRAARANLVVRDGFASFFFHPFLDLRLLQRTISGIRALGYTFVSPASL